MAVVGLVLAIAIVLGLRLRGGDQSFEPKLGVPTEASVADLRELSSPSRPVYWIGAPKAGRLEVTRMSDEAVYVRYLTPGARLGDPSSKYTTIGTYLVRDAYAALQHPARPRETVTRQTGHGELMLWRRSRPTSVYLAKRGSTHLIEIYDPSPSHARSLALSGRVRLVR